MPKRTDISTILIIGAGPIVIGQACEFDYSGTQAVKTLKDEGYRIVLVNSNPATIMTDPELADATYIEPITPEIVAKIIEKERHVVPGGFALLPTMGGQTALNCALSLRKQGTLAKFDVEMIGATADAIDKAEDRGRFREAMTRIGLETPRSIQTKNLPDALRALDDIGLPAIIRPSFTLAGTGGGIAYNKAEFIEIVERGLDASPTTEVLIEESVLGWKEFEMEVVRDKNDNCIIICSIENLDPMGVHTGDSIHCEIEEYEAVDDSQLTSIHEGKEAPRRVRYKVCDGHVACQNERDRTSEQAEHDQHPADELDHAVDAGERHGGHSRGWRNWQAQIFRRSRAPGTAGRR